MRHRRQQNLLGPRLQLLERKTGDLRALTGTVARGKRQSIQQQPAVPQQFRAGAAAAVYWRTAHGAAPGKHTRVIP